MSYSDSERDILLRLALRSLAEGLAKGRPLAVDPADYDEPLRRQRACFVTLNARGNLRGCIGHLEAVQPLVRDVAENAFAAGFRDPRFPPLRQAELADLELHISVLSPAEPVPFSSEADLLTRIRPGIDGLILQDGFHRGTFLPSVWEQLPEVEQFWRHLKRKAGLPLDHWSPNLRLFRYTTEAFGAKAADMG